MSKIEVDKNCDGLITVQCWDSNELKIEGRGIYIENGKNTLKEYMENDLLPHISQYAEDNIKTYTDAAAKSAAEALSSENLSAQYKNIAVDAVETVKADKSTVAEDKNSVRDMLEQVESLQSQTAQAAQNAANAATSAQSSAVSASNSAISASSSASDAASSAASVDPSNIVHITGSETITGTKVFSSITRHTATSLSNTPLAFVNTATLSTSGYNFYNFLDSYMNNEIRGRIFTVTKDDGTNGMSIQAWNGNANYNITAYSNGSTYAPVSDAINSIVTTRAISKAQNGYVKLGNGIIIQWGLQTSAGVGTINFSLPFTASPSVLLGTVADVTSNSTYTYGYSATTAKFNYSSNSMFWWLAVGY